MATFQPPPTWALPILIDERTKQSQFNPIWLKWFVDLIQVINASGGAAAGTHNVLSGLQGGTANQYYHNTAAENTVVQTLSAGVWTPTLTNTTNIAASTAYQGQYLRVGATVACGGRVDVDPTGAGQCVLGLSLPVTSNIAATNDVGGSAFAPAVAGQGAALYGDAANDRATMEWVAVDIANRAMYYSLVYRVA